jgi:flagellar basal-body rod modification protein FlgD
MQLNAISGASALTNKPTESTQKRDLVSTDAFMQLLVAQLKNQDPTKPVDSTQYVSQLASLSGLEQSVKQTAALDRLAVQSRSAEASSAVGLYASASDGSAAGKVVSARIETDQVVAVLDSGQELVLGAGVTLSKT